MINPKLTMRDVLGYLLAYACLILTALLSLLAIIQMRVATNFVWLAMGGSIRTQRAIDRFGLVLLGLIWMAYVIFAENLYRSSIDIARRERAMPRARSSVQTQGAQQEKVSGALRRAGLDILARRFLVTVTFPIVLLVSGYLIVRLSF